MVKRKLSAEEEENEDNKWIQSKMKKTRKRPFTIEKTRGVYDMSSQIRGWCLIFSNHVFNHLDNLVGYERDKENFEGVFTDLAFNVKVFEKVTAQDIKSNIQRYANTSASDGLYPTNALAVVILSHGNADYLFGVNFSASDKSDKISVDEIMDMLSNENCPHLIGKPKIICLQACRGNKTDFGLKRDAPPQIEPQDSKRTPTAGTLRSGKKTSYDEQDELITTLPSVVEDMIVCYATSPNHASYVPLTGSIFGVKLCVYLKRYAWQRDLFDIMVSVNNAIRSKHITVDSKNRGKQVLEMKHLSPTNKLYFNPGYVKSSIAIPAAPTSMPSTSAASASNNNVKCEEVGKKTTLSDQPNENVVNDENAEPNRQSERKRETSRKKPNRSEKGSLGKGQTKIEKYFKKQKTSDSNHVLTSDAKNV